MLNNFIYAQTKELFLEALGAGNILDEAIVFIEDTKEIWNHGHYFAGEHIDPKIISDLQLNVTSLIVNKLDATTADTTYVKKTEINPIGCYYGTCSTAAATAAKTVSVGSTFTLTPGVQVTVTFTNGNTSSTNTLNVNSEGAKNISWGTYGSNNNISAGDTWLFVYSGSYWIPIGNKGLLSVGNTSSGYVLQNVNSPTCGLAISNASTVLDSADGALYINNGGLGKNSIFSSKGNIVAEKGFFKGAFAHNTNVVTGATTLGDTDSLVLYDSTSNATIVLPQNPVDGQIITFIKKSASNTVTFMSGDGTAILNVPQDGVVNTVSVNVTSVGVRNLYYINSR
jgi:hypothetical protein